MVLTAAVVLVGMRAVRSISMLLLSRQDYQRIRPSLQKGGGGRIYEELSSSTERNHREGGWGKAGPTVVEGLANILGDAGSARGGLL